MFFLDKPKFVDPRDMINNSYEWAAARNLVRRNEVHKAEEWRLPTKSKFAYTERNKKSTTKSGTFHVDDPNGSLLEFSDLSESQAMMKLV